MKSYWPNNIKFITETGNTFTYLFICSIAIIFWLILGWVSTKIAQKNTCLSIIGLHSLITTSFSYIIYNIWEFCFTRNFSLILVFRVKK